LVARWIVQFINAWAMSTGSIDRCSLK
jgi:hypothetical protein